MGLFGKLSAGAEKAAKEAEKAFEKGKAKVGELQVEMQMDGTAKKLGYLEFDGYRGRPVDPAYRQKLLDDLVRMEDDIARARAEAAAKREAEAAANAMKNQPPDMGPSAAGYGSESAQQAPGTTAGTAEGDHNSPPYNMNRE